MQIFLYFLKHDIRFYRKISILNFDNFNPKDEFVNNRCIQQEIYIKIHLTIRRSQLHDAPPERHPKSLRRQPPHLRPLPHLLPRRELPLRLDPVHRNPLTPITTPESRQLQLHHLLQERVSASIPTTAGRGHPSRRGGAEVAFFRGEAAVAPILCAVRE